MNKDFKTAEQILADMIDVMPYKLPIKSLAYIIEAMELYAKQGAEWQRKQPVSNWISVGIKEPKVGDEILIYNTYVNAYLVWEFKGQSDYEVFKYWMPLPEPPTT